MKFKNVFNLFFSVLAVCCVASNASAEAGKVNKYNTEVKQDRIIQLSKRSNSSKKLELTESVLNNNIVKVHGYVHKVYSELDELKSVIEPELRKVIEDETPLHYRWTRFDVSGPITVKISGNHDGSVKAEVSGFNVYLKVKAEKGWALNVYATMRIDNGHAEGAYDIYTGKIKNLYVKDDFSLDVDSTLGSIIPFLDNYGEKKLKKIISDSLARTLSSEEGKKVGFGLNEVIVPYKYVYEGTDFGLELQNHLNGMIAGEFISVTAYEKPMLPVHRPEICHEPKWMHWDEVISTINVSNKAFMKVGRHVHQKCTWNWDSGLNPDY